MTSQLVYRLERDEQFHVNDVERDVHFIFLAKPSDLLLLFAQASRLLGLFGVFKAMLKLGTLKRMLYFVLKEQSIVHCGWISLSFCRYYRVNKEDAVIGPVRTLAEYRGRGIATFALQKAMNEMIPRGYRVFYIDTSEKNVSMQRVIAKCGFGDPVSSYPKA